MLQVVPKNPVPTLCGLFVASLSFYLFLVPSLSGLFLDA